jgi:AcrR family transcriptional regulator
MVETRRATIAATTAATSAAPTAAPTAAPAAKERPLRADARQNRDRILAAAREVFVELGPNAPLEEISRRAGTGIATLYRRFPERHALMRAVIMDALERTTQAAHDAAEAEAEPFAALTRYMHQVLEIRVAAVIPALMSEVSLDEPEMARTREAGTDRIESLINAAKEAGTLRRDVAFGDIGTLLVRLSRPLPGPFSKELNDSLAHRHLDLLINGLRAAGPADEHVEGPALSLGDLQVLRGKGTGSGGGDDGGSAG